MNLTISLLLLAMLAFFPLPQATVWLLLAAVVVFPFELILKAAGGPPQG